MREFVKENGLWLIIAVVVLSGTFVVWNNSPLKAEMLAAPRDDVITYLSINYNQIPPEEVELLMEEYGIEHSEIFERSPAKALKRIIEGDKDNIAPALVTPNLDILNNAAVYLDVALALGIMAFIYKEFGLKEKIVVEYRRQKALRNEETD